MNALDAEALQLFHAGTSQRAEWDDFTDQQKDHWRAVARKAREMYASRLVDRETVEQAAKDVYEADHYYGTPWDEARDLERMSYRQRAGVVCQSARRSLQETK